MSILHPLSTRLNTSNNSPRFKTLFWFPVTIITSPSENINIKPKKSHHFYPPENRNCRHKMRNSLSSGRIKRRLTVDSRFAARTQAHAWLHEKEIQFTSKKKKKKPQIPKACQIPIQITQSQKRNRRFNQRV